MAALLTQIAALLLAGAAVAMLARRLAGKMASAAAREAAFIVELLGWLAALVGWAWLLQSASGEMLGLAIWIDSIVVLARVRDCRIALPRHELLWMLSMSADAKLPLAAAADAWADEQTGALALRGREFAARLRNGASLAQALESDRDLLDDSARVAAWLGDASQLLPELVLTTAQWQATHGVARQAARTRLMYGGLMLSTLLVVVAELAARYGLPLAQLVNDSPDRLPHILAWLVDGARRVAQRSAEHPAELFLLTGLLFLPWLLVARSWNWFGSVTNRLSMGAEQFPTSLSLRQIGIARGAGVAGHAIAAALVGACGQRATGRLMRRAISACDSGRPLWLALSEAGWMPLAAAELVQSADRQDAVVERTSQFSRALAHRELLWLRRISAALTLGCIIMLVAAALLAQLTVWLPLLKLSLPAR
ncbi:MAG: hypothetical protein AB7O62_08315 [Pirellulales bacterium]